MKKEIEPNMPKIKTSQHNQEKPITQQTITSSTISQTPPYYDLSKRKWKDVILPSIIYEQNQQHHLVQKPKTNWNYNFL